MFIKHIITSIFWWFNVINHQTIYTLTTVNKDNHHIKVSLTNNPYEIVIGKSSLESIGDELFNIGFREGLKVLVVSNKEVSDHYGDCIIKSLIKNKFNPKDQKKTYQ